MEDGVTTLEKPPATEHLTQTQIPLERMGFVGALRITAAS
jgi:hypothetical protein